MNPESDRIILQQMKELDMIIEINEPEFNEDAVVIDYSIQTDAGHFYVKVKPTRWRVISVKTIGRKIIIFSSYP